MTAILDFLFGSLEIDLVKPWRKRSSLPVTVRAAPRRCTQPDALGAREERLLVVEIEDALKSKSGVAFVRGSRRLSLLPYSVILTKKIRSSVAWPKQTLSNDEDNIHRGRVHEKSQTTRNVY